MESVTVRLLLSTSAKGVPAYTRLPGTSSVKEKLAGAVTVGASLSVSSCSCKASAGLASSRVVPPAMKVWLVPAPTISRGCVTVSGLLRV